jgi:hypothetical protein
VESGEIPVEQEGMEGEREREMERGREGERKRKRKGGGEEGRENANMREKRESP